MNLKHVRMYTRVGCEDSSAARDILRAQSVPFEEVDIDTSPGALVFVVSVNEGKQRTPTFDVDGYTCNCSPFEPQKLCSRARIAAHLIGAEGKTRVNWSFNKVNIGLRYKKNLSPQGELAIVRAAVRIRRSREHTADQFLHAIHRVQTEDPKFAS